jgi:hypothetical protein
MNDANILTIILLMGMVSTLVFQKLISNIVKAISDIKAVNAQNREFKARMAEMDKMKTNGDFHEWIYLPSTAGEIMVCKKTGWCPSVKGFFSTKLINQHLADKQAEEDYKVFRNKRVLQLATDIGKNFSETEKIVEAVFSIKKDFTLLRLTKLQEDLKGKTNEQGN